MKTSKILSIASLSALLAASIAGTAGVFSPILPTEVILGIAAALGIAMLLVSEYADVRRLTVTPTATRSEATLLPATEAFASGRVAVVPNTVAFVARHV